MITASNNLDLFCRVNVQSDMPYDDFVSLIAKSVGGKRCTNLITTNKLDIAVDDNDVFDTEKASTGMDRWLYFRYTLEIDPVAGVAPEEYIVAIGNLLKSLWSSGLDAVAASDFEDQLPRNERRLKWAKGLHYGETDGPSKKRKSARRSDSVARNPERQSTEHG